MSRVSVLSIGQKEYLWLMVVYEYFDPSINGEIIIIFLYNSQISQDKE